jgi:5-methylcytosine-specific restriction endonuclease McrA|tara:strand:- start:472 stop:702 length:231 start_codon:yes stop_codon:yes gene_type:complete
MNERLRLEIWEEYNGMCANGCGRAAAEVDHIKPKSQGGANDRSNYRPLCTPCHRQKRSNIWRNPEPPQEPPRWGGL